MTNSLQAAFGAWSSYYTLLGESAAALTGLMFVVVTLVTRSKLTSSDAFKTYSTPTVLHFAAVLLVSAVSLVPLQTLVPASVAIGILGLYGAFHVGHAAMRAVNLDAYVPDLEDRIAYTGIPMLSYLALAAGAVMLLVRPATAMLVLAASVMLLLFVGIRNAWDLVTYIIQHHLEPDSSDSP